ncbi:MAG: tetratricopeptide repeat protein [Candidatus Kapabacteria bacterium]|nr:tetratricopeptide repeat protein [Candidatus Kapabacteria bacterium]
MKKIIIILIIFLYSQNTYSQYAGAYFERGKEKANSKDYYGAIQDYNKAIELNQDDPYIYFYRGTVYIQLEKYNEAISDLNKCLTIVSSNREKFKSLTEESYHLIGLSKFGLKDYKSAVLYFTKALEFEWCK